jgi:2-hydroxy-6-oxonona-2,4-dienedioate hydrolase
MACLNLLSHLNITSVHILGNSLGGIVGSHIAAKHHDLVKSFTTIGGRGLNIFTAFPGEGLNLLTAFTEDPTKERIEAWLNSMVYDKSLVTDELIQSRFSQATEPKTLATTKELYSQEAIQKIADFRCGE